MVEIMIATTLFLLLGGLLAKFVVTVLGLTRMGYEKSGLRNETVIIVDRFQDDLRKSSSNKIVFSEPSGPGGDFYLSLQRYEDIDVNGFMRWEQQVIVYHWSAVSRTLTRKTWPPVVGPLDISFDPYEPPSLTSAQVVEIAETTNGTERQFSKRVREFSFRPTSEGRRELVLTLEDPNVTNSVAEYRRTFYLDQ